ncbi:MAG: hypothetical protein ACE5JH_09800 [Acidobacteriota bacterium]
MGHCRFVSSWGGVARCGDPVYRRGFCRFQYDCYRRGEITDRGVISERLSDQVRRRAINFHVRRAGAGA